MYEHVKTGCKHIPPSEQPLQFQSGYYLNKPRMKHLTNLSHKQNNFTLHTHTTQLLGGSISRSTPANVASISSSPLLKQHIMHINTQLYSHFSGNNLMVLGHGASFSSNTLPSISSVMCGGVLKKCSICTSQKSNLNEFSSKCYRNLKHSITALPISWHVQL